MELSYIPLTADEIPVSKRIDIDGQEFILDFDHNPMGDFLTLVCRDSSGNVLYSTKLVYGVEANHFYVSGFPVQIALVPANIQDLISDEVRSLAITKSNLDSIKLYIGRKEIV